MVNVFSLLSRVSWVVQLSPEREPMKKKKLLPREQRREALQDLQLEKIVPDVPLQFERIVPDGRGFIRVVPDGRGCILDNDVKPFVAKQPIAQQPLANSSQKLDLIRHTMTLFKLGLIPVNDESIAGVKGLLSASNKWLKGNSSKQGKGG